MNVIWTYYNPPCFHYHVTFQIQLRCLTLTVYTLQISLEVVSHPGTFCLLFYEYCESRHTALVTYCFLPTT